jgi:hypothetical protein
MKYAIIRIKKATTKYNGKDIGRIMDDCYEIASKGYDTAEEAIEWRNSYYKPEFYIIIQYWE